MTYTETLDYMYARLPMFHRQGPSAYKKDLTNTLALCERAGNPHKKLFCIHVAGTNGKGSVSHFLSAWCQSLGLKTGLYVSPHYKDFRERIKVDGRYISRKRVVDFVTRHRDDIEEIQPSFFEMCVVMAFDHFVREAVDIAIIEVGLGGRLDSTNVITPLLSVITNISFDHQAMLGYTLPEIAGEKAGIIKPGIPVVIGETHPESAPVFLHKAAATGSEITFADQVFQVEKQDKNNWLSGIYQILKQGKKTGVPFETPVAGPYQEKNLTTFIGAAEKAFEQPLFQKMMARKQPPRTFDEAIRYGLSHLKTLTKFMGRWQVIGENPTVLCDSAHNEAGLQAAFAHIADIRKSGQKAHIVCGFVNDKEVEKVLVHYPAEARYYFAKADIPRGLDARQLQTVAAAFGLQGRAYSSVKNALKAARRQAEKGDLVLVIGSIFVVAEVLPAPRS